MAIRISLASRRLIFFDLVDYTGTPPRMAGGSARKAPAQAIYDSIDFDADAGVRRFAAMVEAQLETLRDLRTLFDANPAITRWIDERTRTTLAQVRRDGLTLERRARS